MSTKIQFHEIRLGDTVECVWTSTHRVTGVVAKIEDGSVSSTLGGHSYLLGLDIDQFTLVDRPEPALELPSDWSLGTAFWNYTGQAQRGVTMFWRDERLGLRSLDGRMVDAECITAFTPATAVPTEALETLRMYAGDLAGATPALRRIDTFLQAIDEANGPTA